MACFSHYCCNFDGILIDDPDVLNTMARDEVPRPYTFSRLIYSLKVEWGSSQVIKDT